MLLQLEKKISKSTRKTEVSVQLSTLFAKTTRLTFPLYTIKAAHLPINVITWEILLITDCIRTRLTFPFQIGEPGWGYHTPSVCVFRSRWNHIYGVKGVAENQPLPAACSCFCQISASITLFPLALRGKLHFHTCRQHLRQLESGSLSPAGPVKVTDTLITDS